MGRPQRRLGNNDGNCGFGEFYIDSYQAIVLLIGHLQLSRVIAVTIVVLGCANDTNAYIGIHKIHQWVVDLAI